MRIIPSREEDRRESIRVRKTLAVQYKKGLRISGQRWISTIIRDLSETGICIATSGSLRVDSYIRLRLRVPTERAWLQVTGRTVKSERNGTTYATHMKLLNLDQNQKKEIRTYIAWVLVKEGGTP